MIRKGAALMNCDVAQKFQPYLTAPESVRWTGRPQQGLMLRTSDAFVIPFSVLWCAFAIFWETSVIAGNAPPFFVLWGVPFVLVGLYIVVGRFFVDAFVRARTYYALTDRSALILGGLSGDTLTSVNLQSLQELNFKPANHGRGTIMFGPETPFTNGFFRSRYAPATPAFQGVEDAAGAYALIQQQRRAA